MTRDESSFDEPEELAPLEPRAEAELFEALRAAWKPEPLDPLHHRQILQAALEDPFAEPSEEEVRESARLRQALENDDGGHPDVELARVLRSAVKPSAPRTEAAVDPSRAPRATGRVIYATFGAVALAAAAGFALLVAGPRSAPVASRTPSAPAAVEMTAGAVARPGRLLPSRTTGDLFSERFTTGGTTERVDRIALAREHELRDNLYAKWGVP